MRIKRRYVAVLIEARKTSFTKAAIEESILQKVEYFHGLFGKTAARFSVKYWNPSTRIALIRMYLGPHRFITTSLPFVKKINDTDVVLHTIFTGATLKRCYVNIQKFEYENLERIWDCIIEENEKKEIKNCFIDQNIENLIAEDYLQSEGR